MSKVKQGWVRTCEGILDVPVPNDCLRTNCSGEDSSAAYEVETTVNIFSVGELFLMERLTTSSDEN